MTQPNNNSQESAPQHVSGYRKKPLWIYVTALVLMFSPLGNIIWSLAQVGAIGWYKPSVWIYWARFVTPQTWILLVLLFVAGALLLVVRRWSWTFSLVVLGMIAIYDLVMIKNFVAMGPLAVVAMLVGTVSFGLILYFSEFRKPYINPRLRWWETSPRYKVDLPATCSTVPTPGVMVDISRSGVLLQWPADLNIPNIEGNCHVTLPNQLTLPALAKRKTEHGYGMEFHTLNREQKRQLLDFIASLSVDPSKIRR